MNHYHTHDLKQFDLITKVKFVIFAEQCKYP